MHLSRRSFLAALGAAATPAALGGCAGFSTGGGGGQVDGTLTFTTWGTDAELAGFRSAIAAFEEANDGATVTLNAVPCQRMFTNIDAQLQAGNPPDVFRVPYDTFSSDAGRDQLLDLSPYLAGDVLPGLRHRLRHDRWGTGAGHHRAAHLRLRHGVRHPGPGVCRRDRRRPARGDPGGHGGAVAGAAAPGGERMNGRTRGPVARRRMGAAVCFVAALGAAAVILFPLYWTVVVAFSGPDYGATMAFALITVAPMVLVFLLAQRWFVQGFSRSGLR